MEESEVMSFAVETEETIANLTYVPWSGDHNQCSGKRASSPTDYTLC